MASNAEIADQLVEESGFVAMPSWVRKSSEQHGGGSLDTVMALIEGMGKGVPFAGPAGELGRFLGSKITGRPQRQTFSDKAPIAGAIGEGIGMIPGFMAGGTAALGSKIPAIAGKGILSAILRGGTVGTATSQAHDPTLDPVQIGLNASLGAVSETAPVIAKGVAKKLWETVLKRPSGEIAEEILSGQVPIEKTIVERASKFPTSFAEFKEWITPRGLEGMAKQAQKAGRSVMPERNAIIAGIKDPVNQETVVAPLKKEIASYRPGWGKQAQPMPGTGGFVGKLNQSVDEVLKWIKNSGNAEDVEALKEVQHKIASNLYGKGELSPTEVVAKQAAKLTGRGARESLEEAAGAQGPRLASLNKTYGEGIDMADAFARAAANRGKGVGLLPLGLGVAGLGAGKLGETKAGSDVMAGEASIPLLLMAALSSPTGRMMAANMLSKSSPAMRALGPFLSGPSKFFLEGDR